GGVAGAPGAGAERGDGVAAGGPRGAAAGGVAPTSFCCAGAIRGHPTIPRKIVAAAESATLSRRQCKKPPPRSLPPPPLSHRGASQVLQPTPNPEMHEIVAGGEHHQCEHQREPDAKPIFLSSGTQRLSAHCFGGIKQQMTAVKNRNRKQV